MSHVILDDHLLRDLLAGDEARTVSPLLVRHEPATTNLYLYRLTKSVVSARGGALTGRWTPDLRRALGSKLLALPVTIQVVPFQTIVYRMAEIADRHRLSMLGAEAVAAAERLGAALHVWSGDDGPGIRAAMAALGLEYQTVAHR